MEPSNRAAVSYYKTFCKAVEKIQTIDPVAKSAAYKSQLSQMEINLKNIKKIEPEYNASELEAEIEKYKSAIESLDSKKSLDKDLQAIQKGFDLLNGLLKETKLNFDNVDDTVKRSTEAMERDLLIFKKNHPDYDASGFDAQVEEFRTKLREKLQGAKDQNSATKSLRNDLEEVITQKYVNIRIANPDYYMGTNNDTGIRYEFKPEDLARLHDYFNSTQQQCEEYIATADLVKLNAPFVSPDSRKAENGRTSFEASSIESVVKALLAKASASNIRDEIKTMKEVKSDFWELDYFNAKLQILHWNTAAKIFYSIPEFAEMSKLSDELSAAMGGTIEEYQAKLMANRKKVSSKVKMPEAVIQNPEIEALVKQAFESKGWKEEILKINLLSHDWTNTRNAEFIVGREFSAALASKKSNGECMLYVLTIRQEYLMERYSAPKVDSFNNTYIAEENIK
jgi:hypothetical protein